MKRILLPLALGLGLALPVLGQEIITQWNFNAGADGDRTTGTTEPATGTGTAAPLGGVKGSFATGSVADPEPDDDSGWNLGGFPAQGEGARTAGAEFQIPTTGYQDVVLQFDWRTSNTASGRLVVLYTTDGTTWQEAATFTSDKGSWWFTAQAVDFSALDATDDNPRFAVRLVSDYADGANYAAANEGSTYSPNGTWRFDLVTLLGVPLGTGPTAPVIVTPPQSQTVTEGDDVTFSVVATGTPPLSYQWSFAGAPLADATGSTLTLTAVTPAQAGEYQVTVRNDQGEVTSEVATLTVEAAPQPELTKISSLRALVDPENFLPTDTDTLFTVEGVVTTHVNLTSPPNELFYLQDETAGIAVFWRGGANTLLVNAGDRVRITARLTHYQGLLELAPNTSQADTGVTRISAGNPLPDPVTLDFFWMNDPTIIEQYEGSYVVASNVFLETTDGTFPSSGNLWMTNDLFEIFTLRVDRRTDIGGQPIPRGEVSVLGVLSQYDRSDPRTGGYQLMPTRFEDIVSSLKPPTIRFTNVLSHLVRPGDAVENQFREHGLRPGETLTTTFFVFDTEERPVTIEPVPDGLPPTAHWDFPTDATADIEGTFTWTPTEAEAGRLFEATLRAWNDVATNTVTLTLYVPTPAEQDVVITEYLANPTGDETAAHYNPLKRNPPVDATPWVYDEYLELVNLSDQPVELEGWTVSDAAMLRHQFYFPVTLDPKDAFILYGGPLNGFLPNLDVPFEPASESSSGLALNNSGDTITVRNALGGVVARVVYPGAATSPDGSMTRFPTINDGFQPQVAVSDLPVTPGRQYDGKLWSEPPTIPPADIGEVTATLNADGSLTLTWQAQAGRTYTVESAPAVTGPFTDLATGLTAGEYTVPALAERARFYRVSAP